MSIKKVFLYAEIQVAIPFEKIDWKTIDKQMKENPGLKSKTWLSGVNNHSIGGFYEFDSVENARAYATGYLAKAADQLGGLLSVKLFNGDVTAEASKAIYSPFYANEAGPVRVPAEADA
ncbi:YdhR family protein [Methylocystis sp. 9N]|uniref:YdhR family protein n=1 Tax=Methylocystis borbori TaxID=3118750 RepID=A0ABU7XE27_9HYPH